MTATFPWSRFYMPHAYAPASTGAPLPGAKLYFYESGTTTPLTTYQDDALTVPNTNPAEADQYGVFGDIFLQQQDYRVVLTDASGNEVWTADPVAPYVPPVTSATQTVLFDVVVDNGGSTVLTGQCGDLYIPYACTLTGAVLQANGTGSLVIDIWAAPFVVNTPPTVANSIVATAPPTLTSSQSSIDTTLTGWTTTIAANTALRFNINSVASVARFTLTLIATLPA